MASAHRANGHVAHPPLRARVATSRKQGKTLCFLQHRQSIHTVQAVVFSQEGDLVPFAAALPGCQRSRIGI